MLIECESRLDLSRPAVAERSRNRDSQPPTRRPVEMKSRMERPNLLTPARKAAPENKDSTGTAPPQGADINIVYDRWCFDRAQ